MPKHSTKSYLLQYLIDNYVDLTPITLREIGAAVKEPNDKNIYKLLEELKREGRRLLLEPMSTEHGARNGSNYVIGYIVKSRIKQTEYDYLQ